MKLQLILILFISLTTQTLYAQDAQVFYIVRGKKPRKLKTNLESVWKWDLKRSNLPQFKNETLITLPGSRARTAVKSKYGKSKLRENGRKLLISSHYLKNMALLSDGQIKEKIYLKLNPAKRTQSEGCEETFIELKPLGNEFPGPMGLHCKSTDETITFSVAFPGEVSWTTSTLFEKEGKGESWKIYEFTKAQSQSGRKIGTFTIQFNKKSYKYEIASNFSNNQSPTDEDQNRYQVLLGNVSLAAKDINSDASESSFLIGGRFLSKALYSSLRLGVDLNVSQAFSSDENNQPLNYKEFRAFAGYSLFESNFDIAPRIYTVFTDASNPNNGLKMVHQHLGIGMALKMNFTEDFRTQIVYLQSGFLGSVPTSHSSIQLEAGYNLGSFELGLGMEINSYKFETQSRGNPEFSQSMYYLSLGF